MGFSRIEEGIVYPVRPEGVIIIDGFIINVMTDVVEEWSQDLLLECLLFFNLEEDFSVFLELVFIFIESRTDVGVTGSEDQKDDLVEQVGGADFTE